MEILIAILGVLALIPLMLFYSSFSWGFVISKFYLWFVLAAIPGVPSFTIMQFIGFSLFLGAIMPHNNGEHIKEEYRDKTSMWIMTICRPWIVLFFGWLIHLFY